MKIHLTNRIKSPRTCTQSIESSVHLPIAQPLKSYIPQTHNRSVNTVEESLVTELSACRRDCSDRRRNGSLLQRAVQGARHLRFQARPLRVHLHGAVRGEALRHWQRWDTWNHEIASQNRKTLERWWSGCILIALQMLKRCRGDRSMGLCIACDCLLHFNV